MIDTFQALEALSEGQIIAIPTESVYGLSVDSANPEAVENLLKLKNRDRSKGFILITGSLEDCENLIEPLTPQQKYLLEQHWPGPVTFVIPAKSSVPDYLKGEHEGLAIRISDHPILGAIAKDLGRPLISTSANPEGLPPAKTAADVKKYFGKKVAIVEGNLGSLRKPTDIINLLTGKRIR